MSNYPTTNPLNHNLTGPLDAYSNPSVLPTSSGFAQPTLTAAPPMAGTGALASPTAYSALGPTTVYSSAYTVPPPMTNMGVPTTGKVHTVPVGRTDNKVVDNLPSNQQIERTLERVREQVNIAKHETEGLNSTGEKILVDTERLVDSATQFLREKNEGGKVQRLAQEGLLARRDISAQARDARDSWDVVEGFDSERLRSLARETLQTARMAGMELVRSGKFRAQIRSLINLFSEAISADIADSSDSDYDTAVNTPNRLSAQQLGATPSAYSSSSSSSSSNYYERTAGIGSCGSGSTGEVEIPVDGAGVGGLSEKLRRGVSLGRGRKLRLSQEQTDQLAERFAELLRDISRRPSTALLLRKVLDVFRLFDEEIDSEQRGQMTGGLRGMAESEHLKRTLALAQEIFETFTGTRTLDPLIAHWRAIAVSFSRDEETRSYFHSLRRFFADILDHPERLSERDTMDQMKQHIRWAQQLHDEKLHEHLSGTLYEAKAILRQVERDPATLRLKNDAKALLGDIVLDEQGNVVLNTNALEQLRLIIIQSLIERVRIPVPSISIDNPDMQLRLSNVVVTLRDLIPESVVMSNSGRMALNLTNLKEGIDTSTQGQELVFEIKNVNIYIEDADIWFRRNKFPKVEDEGKIRISIGGSGVDLKLIVRTFIRSKNILQVDRVICDVHNMKLHLYETKHNFLYNAVVKILSGKIKHNVERSVEHNIADYMERLNRVLTKQVAVARSKGSHLGPIASLKNRVTHGDTRAMAGETRHTTV